MTEHSSSSRNLRARWAAVGAAVAVTLGAAGIGSYNLVNADVSSGDRPVYIPINPCRLLDTRSGDENVGPRDTPINADETVTITAHGTPGECTGPSAIPTDATALAMNVTALNATSQTFLTFWGEGPNPGTANLNPSPGQPPTPNAVNTPLSGTGTFNLYNERGTVNVVIDVNGYYAPHDHDDRYYTEEEADGRFLPIPDRIVLSPSEFVPYDQFDMTPEYQMPGLLETSGCGTAPVSLPDGATIESITAIASNDNFGDQFNVQLRRTLYAEGLSDTAAAGEPNIASASTGINPTPNEMLSLSSPITGDAVDNGDDAVVDNSTYFYHARVCFQGPGKLAAVIIEFA